MAESIKPDPTKAKTEDSKMLAEEILDEESPIEVTNTNFNKEYEMAQDMSHGSDENKQDSLP